MVVFSGSWDALFSVVCVDNVKLVVCFVSLCHIVGLGVCILQVLQLQQTFSPCFLMHLHWVWLLVREDQYNWDAVGITWIFVDNDPACQQVGLWSCVRPGLAAGGNPGVCVRLDQSSGYCFADVASV